MSFETPLPPYASSDPTTTFLNASCLELLMIEMVPMTFRVVDEVSRPPSYADTLLNDAENGGGVGKGEKGKGAAKGSFEGSTDGVRGGSKSGKGEGSLGAEEEEGGRRELVRRRLEGVGYRVGLGVVER